MKKILFFIVPVCLLTFTSFTAKNPKAASITVTFVSYDQGNEFEIDYYSDDSSNSVQNGYTAIYQKMLHYWGWSYNITSGVDHTTGKKIDPAKSWSANGVNNGDEIHLDGVIE